MVLKHFRDLRVWHLKCLTKAFYGRETRQLSTVPLSPPKKMLGAEDPPPGARFKCGHGAGKKKLPFTSTAAKTLSRLWTNRTLGSPFPCFA